MSSSAAKKLVVFFFDPKILLLNPQVVVPTMPIKSTTATVDSCTGKTSKRGATHRPDEVEECTLRWEALENTNTMPNSRAS